MSKDQIDMLRIESRRNSILVMLDGELPRIERILDEIKPTNSDEELTRSCLRFLLSELYGRRYAALQLESETDL